MQGTLFEAPIEVDIEKIEGQGAVFTKPEVAEFILDLVGYTANKPLYQYRLLEPSCGAGDFTIPAIKRLLKSLPKQSGEMSGFHDLSKSLIAVEINESSFNTTLAEIVNLLIEEKFSSDDANTLARNWLRHGDFLLLKTHDKFDFVVGNPPYVRQELIQGDTLAQYRSLYKTMYDRADLYIPFFERSLSLLCERGTLGFICTDRWMKNKYGGPLRKMIADKYHLKFYIDMVGTDAFKSEVMTYPAITIIDRERSSKSRMAYRPNIKREELSRLSSELLADELNKGSAIKVVDFVAVGEEPWILESFDQLSLIRSIEARFPTLEEAKCNVGIGVATGADEAYIAPFDSLDVEPDRKLPLAMTKDIVRGTVDWKGYGIVNPFDNDGNLVDLEKYPRLKRHFEQQESLIKKRHVALKNPDKWYRTIDKIYPSLAAKPKLLIPDIKGEANIVYENGRLYPHHNLYFITSDTWDLRALQTVLRSGIAKLFVSTYCTKMRGGYLRFQAQYLRRIRIPYWKDVPDKVKNVLIEASNKGGTAACNEAVFVLYGLNENDRKIISNIDTITNGN